MPHTPLDVDVADLGEFGIAAERLARLEGEAALRSVGERGRLGEKLERTRIATERKERRRAKRRSVLSSVIQLGLTGIGAAIGGPLGVGALAGAGLGGILGGPLGQAVSGARPSPVAGVPGVLAGSIQDIQRERAREKRLRDLFEER